MKRVVGADSEHASYPAAQTTGLGIRTPEGTATVEPIVPLPEEKTGNAGDHPRNT